MIDGISAGGYPEAYIGTGEIQTELGLNEWDPLPEGVAYPEEKENML